MQAKYAFLMAIGGVALGAAAGSMVTSVIAQTNAPYYKVVEINVKDQAGYENSGVKEVRAAQDAVGGKCRWRLQQGHQSKWRPPGQPLPDHPVSEQRS